MTTTGRVLVLVAAVGGWTCAGIHLAVTSLSMESAAIHLLGPGADKVSVARWFAWYQCALLFGAATGGLAFGRVGDRFGRVVGLGLSILTYSTFAAASAFVTAPWQLLVLWYLACTGVGGTWPNGVALASEVWSDLSRPFVAGLLGTSANVAIFVMSMAASYWAITPQTWQWVLGPASAPFVLGLLVLWLVPESPAWSGPAKSVTRPDVFRPPLLRMTMIGIVLATVPMIGAWGSANWMVPWASQAGALADPPNPFLKANLQATRSLTGIVGSALGGWIAITLGRRRSYCVVSLAALVCAQWPFWMLKPTDETFLFWVGALGFFSGIYFGWLPLFLPELFPTAARSTGAGVGFNFGRILTAGTIALTGAMMALFAGDYARIGRVTSLVFLVGALAVWLAPDTSNKGLGDVTPPEPSPAPSPGDERILSPQQR